MITSKQVTIHTENLNEIKELYETSFPANERRNFQELITNPNCCNDFLAFYEEDTFIGFAALLTHLDITHILYFATLPHLRGKGYGSLALQAMHKLKQGQRIIADLEKEREGASNNTQRRKRKTFYLRNGFHISEVEYNWHEDDYEILILDGQITNEEFWGFWEHFAALDKCIEAK